jgi:hypothetical protein
MTYDEFVNTYINQRNPATGMYWKTADAAQAAGISPELAESFLTQAQQKNLANVYGAQNIPWNPDEFAYNQQPWYQTLQSQNVNPITGEAVKKESATQPVASTTTTSKNTPRSITDINPATYIPGVGIAGGQTISLADLLANAGASQGAAAPAVSAQTPMIQGQTPSNISSLLANYISSGQQYQPGALTLATLLGQPQPASWQKSGLSYGDIGWGGAPTGRTTNYTAAPAQTPATLTPEQISAFLGGNSQNPQFSYEDYLSQLFNDQQVRQWLDQLQFPAENQTADQMLQTASANPQLSASINGAVQSAGYQPAMLSSYGSPEAVLNLIRQYLGIV